MGMLAMVPSHGYISYDAFTCVCIHAMVPSHGYTSYDAYTSYGAFTWVQ